MVGIYYIALATISNDTGVALEDVTGALGRIAKAGYAFYDFDAELVWIPNHARFEIGAEMTIGDKRRKKVVAELSQADGHRFAVEFRSLYGVAYGLTHTSVLPPPMEHPPSKPNPEGASGDREQVRSGQDQDRTGQVAQAHAREGLVRFDLPLESDAQSVFDGRTFTRSAGLPTEEVWKNFCGHYAAQDFGSREALLGRWSKWIGKQCEIADTQRQNEYDRRERMDVQRSRTQLVVAPAPYHAPFIPADEEQPASREEAAAALSKLTAAIGR